MATQNPIETEGTYPLPEAQVDRFMMKVLVGYPSEEEEFVIVERMTGVAPAARPWSTTGSSRLQRECRTVYVDPSLIQYAVRLAAATRDPERYGLPDLARYLSFGASPRASIHLIEGARALAFLRGRSYALPEDVTDLVPDVLRHRLVLSYEALAESVTADQLMRRIMQHVPAPEKPLETHVDRRNRASSARRRAPAARPAILRRLEWTVIRRLDGALHGDYRTLFRGFGLDLADLREYQYHDDVRHIDWNVTARLGTPYVREFNEDREVTAWFLLDLSPSVDFGSGQVRKRSVSAEFVTVLARLLTRHGNRVGAMFYGERVDTVIPALSGRRQVLHILHRMLARPERSASIGDEPGGIPADRIPVHPRGARWCSSFRISSACPDGRRRWPASRCATRSWRCGSTIRWRSTCPISGFWSSGCRDRRAVAGRHPRPGIPEAFRRRGAAARNRSARGVSNRPAWMRWSCPPMIRSSMPYCASPTCANGAASWRRAAACRGTSEHRNDRDRHHVRLERNALAAARAARCWSRCMSCCCAGRRRRRSATPASRW